jgi:Mak10 subunit, NatC N(alpha)-terminal acetyltransferase
LPTSTSDVLQIKSFEEGVECGAVKMKDFSAAEYLGLIDRSLSNFILWIQGHCLAQTLFTLVYLHQPQKLEDDLLKAYCWCLLALTEHVRQIMIDGCVIEEEDFQVSRPFVHRFIHCLIIQLPYYTIFPINSMQLCTLK